LGLDTNQDDYNIKMNFLKSVVSFCKLRPHKSWIESFEYMKAEVDICMETNDIDNVIIGAGSYTIPIGNYIYKKYKKNVYCINTQIQLFFGIKGQRFDNMDLYNEYWIQCFDSDKPKNYKLVYDKFI